MGTSALGPRVLLRRLREVMAEPVTAQKRLDKIVQIIAANMVAEVCSIYVMRPGDFLELYATEGLKREAVHKSKLKSGEGLVGTIAKQAIGLNLSDAQHHPSFKYLPETGEEIYNSFLGVPDHARRHGHRRAGGAEPHAPPLHRGRRGSAADHRHGAGRGHRRGRTARGGKRGRSRRRPCQEPSPAGAIRWPKGVALGHVVLHEPRVVIQNLIAENVPKEKQRLEDAVAQLRAHVDELLDGSDAQRGATEYSDVLETIRMFAHDKGWVNRLREAIDTGLTAEAAVERVQNDNRARMARTPDPYLRERMHDLDDLSNRLLRILTGAIATASRTDLPQNAIVVARNMGPAELLDYDRSRLRGVVLEEGGRTSHVAIVARALGIPAIGQAAGPDRSRRYRKPHHRRWRHGRGLRSSVHGSSARLCGEGPLLCAGSRRNMRHCATSPRSAARASGSSSTSMRASSSTCRTCMIRAPTAWGSTAPNCSS